MGVQAAIVRGVGSHCEGAVICTNVNATFHTTLLRKSLYFFDPIGSRFGNSMLDAWNARRTASATIRVTYKFSQLLQSIVTLFKLSANGSISSWFSNCRVFSGRISSSSIDNWFSNWYSGGVFLVCGCLGEVRRKHLP